MKNLQEAISLRPTQPFSFVRPLFRLSASLRILHSALVMWSISNRFYLLAGPNTGALRPRPSFDWLLSTFVVTVPLIRGVVSNSCCLLRSYLESNAWLALFRKLIYMTIRLMFSNIMSRSFPPCWHSLILCSVIFPTVVPHAIVILNWLDLRLFISALLGGNRKAKREH